MRKKTLVIFSNIFVFKHFRNFSIQCCLSSFLIDLQEENNNNNNLPNQHAVNDDEYTDSTTQLLQNLTASQNAHQNDANDSLLALAVALRSAANVSPDNHHHNHHHHNHQQQLRQHLSINRNFTVTTSQSLVDKLHAPSISDLDSLAVSNRPHKPPDLKGKAHALFYFFFLVAADLVHLCVTCDIQRWESTFDIRALTGASLVFGIAKWSRFSRIPLYFSIHTVATNYLQVDVNANCIQIEKLRNNEHLVKAQRGKNRRHMAQLNGKCTRNRR